ncbi:unnamed protein product [Lathyrus sativus]|nr:unnamed protein product [Lathyrus sativus]
MAFSVSIHYGRKFVKDSVVYYLGGDKHVVDIDLDRWSFFEAIAIVKEICNLKSTDYWLWWYNIISGKHVRIVSDIDIAEVYEKDVETNCSVDLFVEHKVVVADNVVNDVDNVNDNVDNGNVDNVDEVDNVIEDNVHDNVGNGIVDNVDDIEADNVIEDDVHDNARNVNVDDIEVNNVIEDDVHDNV